MFTNTQCNNHRNTSTQTQRNKTTIHSTNIQYMYTSDGFDKHCYPCNLGKLLGKPNWPTGARPNAKNAALQVATRIKQGRFKRLSFLVSELLS